MPRMGGATYDDLERLDLRVARVISVDPIDGKTRIVRGRIDLGGGDVRDVVIGGADRFEASEMEGRMAVAVANMEPREVAGVRSEAMLLAADIDGRPYWLSAGDGVPAGTRIK